MTRVENRPLRIFLNESCSISYRQEKRGRWTNEGSAGYGLVFLFAGEFHFATEATKGELRPGNFFLINPATPSNYSTRDASLLVLEIAPALMIDCALRTRLGGPTHSVTLRANESLGDSTLARLAEDLGREMTEAEMGHEAVIAALVEQVVVHLLRHYSILRRADTLELSRVGLIDRRIRRAVELMLAQLDQELSLKDMAAASYLSPFHFARLFKKLTGTTPHAYLATLRITAAQRLLAETDLSVTEISVRVGYSSPSHFSKGFRYATGLTPRAFRASLVSRKLES
jgi:AraC family transcriptional regulator